MYTLAGLSVVNFVCAQVGVAFMKAFRSFLLVKHGRSKIVKIEVNPAVFGRGANKCLRRVHLHELVDEVLVDRVRHRWRRARVYTLFPYRCVGDDASVR